MTFAANKRKTDKAISAQAISAHAKASILAIQGAIDKLISLVRTLPNEPLAFYPQWFSESEKLLRSLRKQQEKLFVKLNTSDLRLLSWCLELPIPRAKRKVTFHFPKTKKAALKMLKQFTAVKLCDLKK